MRFFSSKFFFVIEEGKKNTLVNYHFVLEKNAKQFPNLDIRTSSQEKQQSQLNNVSFLLHSGNSDLPYV